MTWSKHKWEDQAKVSINLGPSPRNGRSISLLLNTQIGIITPQCHVRFGDAFDTSRRGSDVHLPKSLWQEKTYFRNQPGGIIATVLGYADVVTSNQPPQDGEGGLTILSEPLQPKGVPVALPIPPPVTPPPPTTTTRSGWEVRPLTRFLDNFSNIANYGGTPELVYQEYHPLTIFLASSDPDTLNLEQALRAPDREEFINSMLKEVRDQESRKYWAVVPLSLVPEGARVLPAVWEMSRKRDIQIQRIYKWKSRLNVGVHCQRLGIDYDPNTYSLIVGWPTI